MYPPDDRSVQLLLLLLLLLLLPIGAHDRRCYQNYSVSLPMACACNDAWKQQARSRILPGLSWTRAGTCS